MLVCAFCFNRLYGTKISLKLRQELRMKQYFESREDAQKRVDVEQSKQASGLKRKKDHVGNISNYTFDQENCINEIDSYDNDHNINFSGLASRHHLKNSHGNLPDNGGQVLKEILLQMNYDFSRFTSIKESVIRIRRQCRR